jgi:hypothetical protein
MPMAAAPKKRLRGRLRFSNALIGSSTSLVGSMAGREKSPLIAVTMAKAETFQPRLG